MTPRFRHRSITCLGALLASACVLTLGAAPLSSQPRPRDGAIEQVLTTPHGPIYKIHRRATTGPLGGGGTAPSFNGATYDFQHQVGALIDGIFQCFDVHMANMEDNTVTFDGITELLDPYTDGTQPAIFEFETGEGVGSSSNFFNSFSGSDTDLFPEGFEDPETGTPLDAACLEIGIDDTLDSDLPAEITSATLEASGDDGTILPITDITSLFSDPWDGRLSLVVPGLTGQGVNGMVLELQMEPSTADNIFSDGFESGNTASWTDQSP